jgi:outer membrane receptor protein involved in Fe transport
LSLDYYDIKIDNALEQPKEQSIIDACYLYEKDANGPFCSLIHRNTITGSLNGGTDTGVDASIINAGKVSTKGIDIAASYTFSFETNGSLDFRIDAVNVLENKTQDAAFLPVNDCVGLVGKTCTRPDPKWRFIQSTTWTSGPLSLKLRWQYLDGLEQDAIVLGDKVDADYAKPFIEHYNYFDLYASYEVIENVTLRAGVTNLFDKKPPIVGNEFGGTTENSGNTFPATYDPIGRSAFLGVNMHF